MQRRTEIHTLLSLGEILVEKAKFIAECLNGNAHNQHWRVILAGETYVRFAFTNVSRRVGGYSTTAIQHNLDCVAECASMFNPNANTADSRLCCVNFWSLSETLP